MDKKSTTVAEALRQRFEDLTRAERQLADTLLSHYPAAGLGSITALAEKAEVSTPTVARLVKKLGFTGYPEFQESLRGELDAATIGPITKHDARSAEAPDEHMLNRFAEAVTTNLRSTFSRIDPASFDVAAGLLADQNRGVSIVGGRITRALADYLFTHMQVIRDSVTLVPSTASSWPHYLLSMSPGDVLVVFDVRRYENDLVRFAEIARERQVTVILFTDQWGSPVAKHAQHVFNCRVEAPSAWDSTAIMLVVVEALIAATENLRWDATRERMEVLEDLFDRTGLLKKFL